MFFNIVFLKRQTTVTPRGDDPKASWVIHHRENRCFTIYYTLLHINQHWRRYGLCPRLSNLVWRNFKGYCGLFWVSFELGPRGNPHPLPTFLLNGPAQEDQLLVLTINVFIQWRNGVFFWGGLILSYVRYRSFQLSASRKTWSDCHSSSE